MRSSPQLTSICSKRSKYGGGKFIEPALRDSKLLPCAAGILRCQGVTLSMNRLRLPDHEGDR